MTRTHALKPLVGRFIGSALLNLFDSQPDLSEFVPQETQEREPNLSFHLANELWKYLFWLNCDFDVTKSPHEDQRPDIVFHKRGTNALNFLVIEVKRTSNRYGNADDIGKIRDYWFGGNLQYTFGASVVINEKERTSEVCLMARTDPKDELVLTNRDFRERLRLPDSASADLKAIKELADEVTASPQKSRLVDAELERRILALYLQPR